MKTFSTSREISATPEQIFAAISNPERLARWWGPAGFSSTFTLCEFKPGGRWSFVLHGPDGKNYPNENIFAEIDSPKKVVIRHVVGHKFSLTIELTASAKGTRLTWDQAFENADEAKRIEHIVVPSNEQNLDRLEAELARGA